MKVSLTASANSNRIASDTPHARRSEVKSRRMTLILCLSVFALLGPLSVWAAGSAESGAAKQTTVTWWSPQFNDPRGATLAAKYMQANPNVKVDVQGVVAQGLQDKILVALQSGSVPDLIDVAVGWNIPYAATGQLLALNDYIAKSSVIQQKDFWPANWQSTVYNGKGYGIPYRAESYAFIYNKGLYRAAGLDPNSPPKTWNELIACAQKLTKATGDKPVYGYGVVGGGEVNNLIFNLLPQIWMNGGDVLSPDLKRVIINEPAAVQAVQFYTDLYTKYHVAPATTLQNDGVALRNLFGQQVIAQFEIGSYVIGPIHTADASIELGFGPMPTPEGKKPATVLGGWNYVVPKNAPNKDGAWKFLEFLASPDNMAFYTDTFPATATAMKNTRFYNPDFQAFIAMLPYTRMTPPVKSWIQMSKIIQTEVQNILLGQKSAQQAMDDAATQMTPLLDQ